MSQKIELLKEDRIQCSAVPEQIFQAAHGDPVLGQEELTVLPEQLQRVVQEHVEGFGEILFLVREATHERPEVGRERNQPK
jgi:hypothetical protein